MEVTYIKCTVSAAMKTPSFRLITLHLVLFVIPMTPFFQNPVLQNFSPKLYESLGKCGSKSKVWFFVSKLNKYCKILVSKF